MRNSVMGIEIIQKKIYEVRGYKIILDFELAKLYEVETRVLNQTIKRNINRFPSEFMFRLNKSEWEHIQEYLNTQAQNVNMSSQNVMTLPKQRPKTALPYAFTEHGVAMLASVLKSEKAVKMSVAVVRAFISLKKSAMQYSELADQIQALRMHLGEHDVQLNSIYGAIENLLEDKVDKKVEQEMWAKRKRIGFKTD